MNLRIAKAATILGSLLLVGSAQAADNQGFQTHGNQFTNYNSGDISCVERYTQGVKYLFSG